MSQKSNFIIRGGLDVSGITKGLNKTQAQLTKFQSNIGKAVKGIAIALGGLAIGSYIKDSVQDAMGVESSVNQINRIMGENANVFKQWANTQAKSFGMARSEAYKYGSVYGNLISGFAQSTEQTEKYTTDLLKASAVTASATGRTMEDTMERIRSGLLGNTEAIEDLGINVNVALLQTTNAFKQIAGNRGWKDLSFQEQQQIRLLGILEQANIKYGNSLAGTTATRQMNFLATLKNIKLNIGQAFLPIYNTVLPILDALASKLEYVTSIFAQFMQAIFGKTISTTSAITDSVGATTDLADATDSVGNSASKTAKKVQKSLAPIDQINQLSDNSSSKSGGSGGSSGGVSSIGDTSALQEGVSEISPQVQKLIDKFNALKQAIEPTTTALKNLWNEGLSKLGGFVLGGLSSLWTDFLKPVGSWVLGEKGLPKLINCLNSILNDIDWNKLNYALSELLKALTPLAISVGQGFIDFITEIGEALKPAIVELLSLLADVIVVIAKALKKVDPKTMEEFGRLLGAIYISNKKVTGLTNLATALGKLVVPLKTLKELGAGSILTGIGKGLTTIALVDPTSLSIILGDLVTKLDEALAKLTTDKFGKFWTDFLGILSTAGIGAAAGFAFGGLPGAIIGAIIGALLGYMTTDMFKDFWSKFKKDFKDSMDTIFNFDVTKKLFDDMAKNFKEAFTGNKSFGEIGKNILLGILEGFTGAITFIVEPIADFFDGVVKAICNVFGIHSPATKMKPIGKNILLGIRDGFVNAITSFTTILSNFKDKCFTALGNIKSKFISKGSDIIKGIKQGITDGWDAFSKFLSNIPSKISTAFGNLKTLFVTKGASLISGIKQGWSDGWNDFKTWLSNLPSKIGSGIGSLKEVGKNLISGFISGLKSISIPKLKVSLGSTTKDFFGKKVDVPKLNIDWYAKGGVFNKPSVIGVGEAGKEAVMPLENNTGWITDLAGKISTQINVGGGSGLTEPQLVNAFTKALKTISGDTVLVVGNEELARATNKGQASLDRRMKKIVTV